MSFLDNLESNLKNLERNNERDTASERSRRQSEKAQALASAPFAEELKKGPFAPALIGHATHIGFGQRTKVNMVWLGSTLRLDAKEKRLELKPTPSGIIAVFSESGAEVSSVPLDLSSDPQKLAREWLEG